MSLLNFTVDPVVLDDIPWPAGYRGPLTISTCQGCNARFTYPRTRCTSCMSPELELVPVGGEGTVHTFTVVRRGAPAHYSSATPYVVALVDLGASLQILTQIDAVAEDVAIGDRVRVVFGDTSDGTRALPAFVRVG